MSTFVGRQASIAEALAIIGVSDDTPKQPHLLSPSASSSSLMLPAIAEVDVGETQGPTAVVSGGSGDDEEHYDDPDGDEWDGTTVVESIE